MFVEVLDALSLRVTMQNCDGMGKGRQARTGRGFGDQKGCYDRTWTEVEGLVPVGRGPCSIFVVVCMRSVLLNWI